MGLPTPQIHRKPEMLSGLLDLVFAPACLACGSVISTGDSRRYVCRRCLALLRALPPPCCRRCGASLLRTGSASEYQCGECAHWPASLRYARSACLMHPPADAIVHHLKYGGWRVLAEPMAERLLSVDLPDEVRTEARYVVAVPTSRARLRGRGYNQAALLAGAYARSRGLERLDALERTRAQDTQTALQPMQRAANVAGAFRLNQGAPQLAGEHILLIDDVLTTGATVAECATALVAGGARCVSVLTFARALDARRLIGS
jgi:ComF family protein